MKNLICTRLLVNLLLKHLKYDFITPLKARRKDKKLRALIITVEVLCIVSEISGPFINI